MTAQFPDVSELPARETLPDPLSRIDGSALTRIDDWSGHREYLLDLLEQYLYGPLPSAPHSIEWETKATGTALDGEAIVEFVEITLQRVGTSATVRVGVLRPDRPGSFPVVVKNDRYLFGPDDPEGTDTGERGARPELAPADPERNEFQAFANEAATSRGYVLCKFAREDVAVDADGHRDTGVFPLYPERREWGVIGAWAWFHRALVDGLLEREYVDPGKIVVTGHSRGGKTALCAGIIEDRIAVTAPNSSGSGGTGSWRYFDDEHDEQTLSFHEEHHAHWWSPRLFDFVGAEDRLPFDANTLRAAVAPRAVLNTHARQDWWANPYGTALAAAAAQPVFDWLGVGDHNAQHWREGSHDQAPEDWAALFDFCDRYFFDRRVDRSFEVNPYPDRYSLDVPEDRAPRDGEPWRRGTER